jgi:hypothetical protein
MRAPSVEGAAHERHDHADAIPYVGELVGDDGLEFLPVKTSDELGRERNGRLLRRQADGQRVRRARANQRDARRG